MKYLKVLKFDSIVCSSLFFFYYCSVILFVFLNTGFQINQQAQSQIQVHNFIKLNKSTQLNRALNFDTNSLFCINYVYFIYIGQCLRQDSFQSALSKLFWCGCTFCNSIIVFREQYFGFVVFFSCSQHPNFRLFLESGKGQTSAVFTKSADLRQD